VLKPRYPITALALLYVGALLNRMTWRYSYGRKCFREKLEQVELLIPTRKEKGKLVVDEGEILKVCPQGMNGLVQGIAEEAGAWA
jgi:hypothetical protein